MLPAARVLLLPLLLAAVLPTTAALCPGEARPCRCSLQAALLAPGADRLGELSLRDCGLERLEAGALRSLQGLRRLDLSGNRLVWLALPPLPQLLSLDVSGNRLDALDLSNVSSGLEFLNVSRNSLVSLELAPSEVMSTIDASYNKLGNNLDFLGGLPKLRNLWLAANNITNISAGTFRNNTGLYYVRLDENGISDAGFLRGLASVEGLSLSGNQLSDIPAYTFANFYYIECLYLERNNLSDTTFLTFLGSSLTRLHLSQNNISNIRFNTNNRIKHFHVDNNSLESVEFVKELPMLEELVVDNNRISRVRSTLFENHARNIHSLFISHNLISNLDFVAYMNNLTYLVMENNNLTYIRPYVFNFSSSNLKGLYLSSNKIKTVEFVRALKSLEEFCIMNNSISSLPKNVLCSNENLKEISFCGNPIESDTVLCVPSAHLQTANTACVGWRRFPACTCDGRRTAEKSAWRGSSSPLRSQPARASLLTGVALLALMTGPRPGG